MIMANREFLKNRNINERNSLPDLMQNISPDTEEEINFIDHSIYSLTKNRITFGPISILFLQEKIT